jgi:hypothetical protein
MFNELSKSKLGQKQVLKSKSMAVFVTCSLLLVTFVLTLFLVVGYLSGAFAG